MAKYGISGVIGGGTAEGGAVERHMLGFQAAYDRRGKSGAAIEDRLSACSPNELRLSSFRCRGGIK
jgi:hypothetical protein